MPAFNVKGVPFGQDRPKVTVSIMETTPETCTAKAREAIQKGAEVIEWRADYAEQANTQGISAKDMVEQFGEAFSEVCRFTPLICTLRTEGEGGVTQLDDTAYIEFVKTAIESKLFDFIDIEGRIGDDEAKELCDLAHQAHLRTIVSKHILDGTPSVKSMVKTLQHLSDLGADMPKLAVMSYGPHDTVDLLTASTEASNEVGICPLITMAMDSSGTITRVAGQQFGSAIAFAALDNPSAPGQMGIRPTRQIISLLSPAHSIPEDKEKPISGSTHMVCLLGDPVEHSLSPAIHNASFARCGIDAKYLAFDVKESELPSVLDTFRALGGVDGCNITMPLKRAAAQYADELSPVAKLTNSVNVISFEEGKAKGFNTDGSGLIQALAFHRISVKDATMTVLGTGGAAASIIAAAALEGAHRIFVLAHSEHGAQDARDLAKRISEQVQTEIEVSNMSDTDQVKKCLDASSILINATNVGMGEADDERAHIDESPIPTDILPEKIFVMDAIYYPRETKLIRDARKRGIPAFGGIEMLVAQAAESERIWYRCRMNILATMQQLA